MQTPIPSGLIYDVMFTSTYKHFGDNIEFNTSIYTTLLNSLSNVSADSENSIQNINLKNNKYERFNSKRNNVQ